MTVGHSPDADQAWVSAILAIRLPLYPKLRIRLISQFSIELVRSVIAGELNLALVTAPPEDSKITAVPFARDAALCGSPTDPRGCPKGTHRAPRSGAEMNGFCSRDEFTPSFMTQFMDAARREGIAPKHAHDIITAQQAVHLVSEHVGVAILTKPTAAWL